MDNDYGRDDVDYASIRNITVARTKHRPLRQIEKAERGMAPPAYRERGVGMHCERLTLAEISELSKEIPRVE